MVRSLRELFASNYAHRRDWQKMYIASPWRATGRFCSASGSQCRHSRRPLCPRSCSGEPGRAAALVSVDVLALPAEFVTRVRRAIKERTGIATEAVMIASTHTHAGPVTITTFFNPEECLDATYMNRLAASDYRSGRRGLA